MRGRALQVWRSRVALAAAFGLGALGAPCVTAQPAPLGEPREIDAAQAEAWRLQGERERDARRLRGGLAPAPPPTPRIQPDAPPVLSMPPPPRIAIPQAGEPGGPPIALPSCGPAGCFDANGRALPSAGGGVLIGPGGRPCARTGAMATC